MSRFFPRHYAYQVFARGKWHMKLNHYGGNTQEEADALAISRLQHLWNGSVKMIRRFSGEVVIWDRAKQEAA